MPSQLIEVTDPRLALDFDLASTYRLLVFDNERERDRFKVLSVLLGGEPETDGAEKEIEGGAETW